MWLLFEHELNWIELKYYVLWINLFESVSNGLSWFWKLVGKNWRSITRMINIVRLLLLLYCIYTNIYKIYIIYHICIDYMPNEREIYPPQEGANFFLYNEYVDQHYIVNNIRLMMLMLMMMMISISFIHPMDIMS